MDHTTDELVDGDIGKTATMHRRRMSTTQAGDVDDIDAGHTQPDRQPRQMAVTQQRRRVDMAV